MSVVSRITGNEGRLTPDEIRSMDFPPARLGRRGLDEDRVRAFCARVEEEILFLLNERAELYQHAEILRQQVNGAGGVDSGYVPEAAHLQAVQILTKAQKTADRVVGEAHQYVRALAEGAKARRDQMLADARRDASRMLEQADGRARTAVAETASRSRGRHGNAQEEAEYLRTFSEVYRTHLRAYLEALLRNIDEWGRAERASFGAAGSGVGAEDQNRNRDAAAVLSPVRTGFTYRPTGRKPP